jgi:hypothetical protein
MSTRRLVAIATVLVLAGGVLAGVLWRQTPPRQLVVSCRNMTFVMPGNPSPNPVITVRAGETIALEVRNEDGPGILHDFAIDLLGVSTELLLPGQVAHATFTAPDHPGRFDYYCRPHALIMRGTLDVVAP